MWLRILLCHLPITLPFSSVNPGQLACWVLKAFSADQGKEGTAKKRLGRPSSELFTLGPHAPGRISEHYLWRTQKDV